MAGSKRGKALRAAIEHLLTAWDAWMDEDHNPEATEAPGEIRAPAFGMVAAEVEHLRKLLASQLVGRKPS